MSKTRVGLGLAAIGRPDYINIRQTKTDKSLDVFRANAYKVLNEAYQLGIRDFDVAPSYGYGEDFLMQWKNKRDLKQLSISTKWGYTYVADWEIGYTGKHEIKEHSLNKLNEQWVKSKLFLPELSIYQIHSATFESGVLQNVAVLERLFELKQKHRLKIGISTSGVNQKEVIQFAEGISINGSTLFDSYQVTYNIFEQSTFETLTSLIKNGKTVIIKEALANGRIFPNDSFPNYKTAHNILAQLSKKYNVGMDAIALRFTIDHLKPELVLSGASNIIHLTSNLKSLNFELTNEDLQKLKSLSVDASSYWTERSKLAWQ